jgi:peroxiredoxin
MSPALGEVAPEFTLPDTAGAEHSPGSGGERVTVVVFTCNHRPCALAWHDRFSDVARDYAGRGICVLAINSKGPRRRLR